MKLKSKALLALAVTALFSSAAIAEKSVFYSEASEENFNRDTLDMKTGGYLGWGPMHNPVPTAADRESTAQRDEDLIREEKAHMAEMKRERERVWLENEPVRNATRSMDPHVGPIVYGQAALGNPSTAVGGTRSSGGGILRFFQRDR